MSAELATVSLWTQSGVAKDESWTVAGFAVAYAPGTAGHALGHLAKGAASSAIRVGQSAWSIRPARSSRLIPCNALQSSSVAVPSSLVPSAVRSALKAERSSVSGRHVRSAHRSAAGTSARRARDASQRSPDTPRTPGRYCGSSSASANERTLWMARDHSTQPQAIPLSK